MLGRSLFTGAGTSSPLASFSQRSVINMNFVNFNMYAMINHYLFSNDNTGPQIAWSTSTTPYGANIDATTGWVNTGNDNTNDFGGSFGMPGPDEFNGAYVFQWTGDGRISVQLGNVTWTETNFVPQTNITFSNGSANISATNTLVAGQIVMWAFTAGGFSTGTKYYVSTTGLSGSGFQLAATLANALAGTSSIVANSNASSAFLGPYQKFGSNGGWFNTQGASGADAQIIAIPSGATGPQQLPVHIPETNKYSAGSYLTNLLIYRLEDQADLNAGKIFRTKWKQPLVNLNPSAIRFMVWYNGGNPPSPCRFENRGLPLSTGHTGGNDYYSSPCYQSNLVGRNALTLVAATPTSTNTKTTPVAPFHGEVVTCRMDAAGGNDSQRCGQNVITGITNANPGVVTTQSAHGYNTGDVIFHIMQSNVIAVTGSTSGSSTTLTTTNSPLLVVGQFLRGPGIVSNTKIVSGSVNSWVMSQANTIPSNTSLSASGMDALNYVPCTITVTGSTTYSIGVDTTNFGVWNPASTSQFSSQYLTLSVAGRTACQIMQPYGNEPEGWQVGGINFANSNGGNVSFFFDKTIPGAATGTYASFTGSISGTTLTVTSGTITGTIAIGQALGSEYGSVAGGTTIVSGSGNTWTVSISQTTSSRAMFSQGWINGVWLWNYGGNGGDFALETCVAMTNEINAMSVAQGITGKVGMWINAPVRGLTVIDPDYTTASDYGLGMADVCTNPSSTLRYPGFSALTSGIPLYIEWGNEIWNITSNHTYTAARQQIRWPGTSQVPTDGQALLSSVMMHTIKAAFSTSQIKCVMAGWAIGGINSGGLINNAQLISGSNTLNTNIGNSPGYSYTNDPYIVSNSYGTPISNHDAFAIAPYFDPSGDYAGQSGGCIFQNGNASVQYFGMLFAVNQKIVFSNGSNVLPSNVTAGTVYKVTANTGGPGNSTFTFSTLGGSPITPNAAGNCTVQPIGQGVYFDDLSLYLGIDNSGALSMTGGTGGSASTTLTITAVASSTPVVGQYLVGNGITSAIANGTAVQTTYITAVSGTSPNYTLTLNQNVAVTNGTTITSWNNNGGNYISAANQTQAVTNFVTGVNTNSGGGPFAYCNSSGGGLVSGFTGVLQPLGKPLINYEGGFDWANDISSANPITFFNGTIFIDAQMAVFLTATYQSTQWEAAQLGYFNNCQNLVPGTAMQGVFVHIGVGTRRWSYAYPDSFSGTTEGAALAANPTWAAMCARNQAIST